MHGIRVRVLACFFSLVFLCISASVAGVGDMVTPAMAQDNYEAWLNSCDTNWIMAGIPALSPLGALLLAVVILTAGVLLLKRRWKSASSVLLGSVAFVVLGATTALPIGYLSPALDYPPPCKNFTRVLPAQEWSQAEREAIELLAQLLYPDAVQIVQPSRLYNCHTYTLYGEGKDIWVHCHDVTTLLAEDGYAKIGNEGQVQAHVGDVIVYSTVPGGTPTHTAKVTEVDGNGNVTKVRSKWGAWGLYDHPVGHVPPAYGTVREVWRK